MLARVRIIGVGASDSVEHFNASALVSMGSENILIDCGYTAKVALHRQGFSFADVTGVYISHLHADHVFGLERLGSERLFSGGPRPTLYIDESLVDELWQRCLSGSMGHIYEGRRELHDYFNLVPLHQQHPFYIGKVRCEQFEVIHTPNKRCFGVNIGHKLLFTGDTMPIADVLAAQTFDVGFHDVSFYDENPVHAGFNKLINQYPPALRNKLYLIGYNDNWRDFTRVAAQHFKGLAHQGMEMDIV